MVAVQSYPETAANVVSRKSKERMEGVIPLEKWNFCDGRGRKYDLFRQSLTRTVKLLEIEYVFIKRTVDSFEVFEAWHRLAHKGTRTSAKAVRDGYDDYVLGFQVDISVLYHLLYAATDFVSNNEDWKEDSDIVNGMIAGPVADGVLFFEWLMAKIDVTSLDEQAKVRLRIVDMTLSPNCTVSQLKQVTRALLDEWLLLNNTDLGAPADFYEELKRVLPKNPPTSYVGQTRTRLCNMLADKVPLISDPKLLIKTLAVFASDIGMPPGVGASEDAVTYINNGGVGGGGNQRTGKGKGKEGRVAAAVTPHACCNSWICDGPPKVCICHPSSTVTMAQLKAKPSVKQGACNYVDMQRAYWKANPQLTTIKGHRTKIAGNIVTLKPGEKPHLIITDASGTRTDVVTMLTDAGGVTPTQAELLSWMEEVLDSAGSQDIITMIDGGASESQLLDGGAKLDTIPEVSMQEAIDLKPTVEEKTALQQTFASDALAKLAEQTKACETSAANAIVLQAKYDALQQAHADTASELAAMRLALVSQTKPSNTPASAIGVVAPSPSLNPNLVTSRNQTLSGQYKDFVSGVDAINLVADDVKQLTFSDTAESSVESSPKDEGTATQATAPKDKVAPTQYDQLKALEKVAEVFKLIITPPKVDRKTLLRTVSSQLAKISWQSWVMISLTVALIIQRYGLSPLFVALGRTIKRAASSLGLRVSFLLKLVACGSVTQLRLILSRVALRFADAVRNQLVLPLPASPSPVLGEAGVDPMAEDPPLVAHVAQADQILMISSADVMIIGPAPRPDGLPSLSDGGATISCRKSLDGADLASHDSSSSGSKGVGNESAALQSNGTYKFYETRSDRFGNTEHCVRLCHHTPQIPVARIDSEGVEKKLGYTIIGPASENGKTDRCFYHHRASNTVYSLFVTPNGLSWWFVRPCQDQVIIERLRRDPTPIVATVPVVLDLARELASTHTVALIDSSPQMPSLRLRGSAPPVNLVSTVGGLTLTSGNAPSPSVVLERCYDMLLLVDATLNQSATSLGRAPPLTGVALLRRAHIVYGHLGINRLIATLMKHCKALPTAFTKQDVIDFQREGCGTCESTKMKSVVFKSLKDRTKPLLCSKWTRDAVELPVVSLTETFRWLMFYVEAAEKIVAIIGMRDYTADSVILADNELRAEVRPIHGEIMILRGDSHPSHRAWTVQEVLHTLQTRSELSAPYCHEGASDCEIAIHHDIPGGNALILQSIDLDKKMLFQAILTSSAGRMLVYNSEGKQPRALFLKREDALPNLLRVFGSPAKTLIQREKRGSHFNDHAQECVYVGPSYTVKSDQYCAVLTSNEEILPVHLGNLVVDERPIIARCARNHPSHQRYGQDKANPVLPVATDLTKPYDPTTEAHPATAGKLTTEFVEALAEKEPVPRISLPMLIWLPSSAYVPAVPLCVELMSGGPRAGDIGSHLMATAPTPIEHARIDRLVGGYNHDMRVASVIDGLQQLAASPHTFLILFEFFCGPWSALKFIDNGKKAPILFDLDFPGGILVDGVLPANTAALIKVLDDSIIILDLALGEGKLMICEHPASQAAGEIHASRGCEKHATLLDYPPMAALIVKYNLKKVLTDQCMRGARARKPTVLLVSPELEQAAQARCGGNLCTGIGWHANHDSMGAGVELDAYKSLEIYTNEFASDIAFIGLRALSIFTERKLGGPAVTLPRVDPVPTPVLPVVQACTGSTGADDLFPAGSRVEVWWPLLKDFYPGLVDQTRLGSVHLLGRKLPTREIHVQYDDNWRQWHSLHNHTVRFEDSDRSNGRAMMIAFIADLSHDTDVMPGLIDPGSGCLLFVHEDIIDLETGSLVSSSAAYAPVGDEMELVLTIFEPTDVAGSHLWLAPKNEREYTRSPQHALWRTAKELKMDEYIADNQFTLVLRSSLPPGTVVYDTLWVHTLKDLPDGTRKMGPRWCAKGGTQPAEGTYAEQAKMSTHKICFGVKSYWPALLDGVLDARNAFQNTRTDEPGSTEPPFYTRQAIGFAKYGPNREELVAEHNVYMQGRRDSTNGFERKKDLLLHNGSFLPCLFDRKFYIYVMIPGLTEEMNLNDIIVFGFAHPVDHMDIGGGIMRPVGWCVVSTHVDDGIYLATSPLVRDHLFDTYRGLVSLPSSHPASMNPKGFDITVKHGWHGQIFLTFDIRVGADGSVSMSALSRLAALADVVLAGHTRLKPKHIMCDWFFGVEAGVLPPADDPRYADAVKQQSLDRHGLGGMIYFSQGHPTLVTPCNALCGTMHMPSNEHCLNSPLNSTAKGVRHVLMFMTSGAPEAAGATFGRTTEDLFTLESMRNPYVEGHRPARYWCSSDASPVLTGVVAGTHHAFGGNLLTITLRAHLAAPCAHSIETVAGGTNHAFAVPINGVLQQLRIRCGRPTPILFDSQSTIYVATDDTAVKKSAWTIRRCAVLRDGVRLGELLPLKIGERDMTADIASKYCSLLVWKRHCHILLNMAGDPPNAIPPSDAAVLMVTFEDVSLEVAAYNDMWQAAPGSIGLAPPDTVGTVDLVPDREFTSLPTVTEEVAIVLSAPAVPRCAPVNFDLRPRLLLPERSAVDNALRRQAAGRPLPADEVTLSHAVSRGVREPGMSPYSTLEDVAGSFKQAAVGAVQVPRNASEVIVTPQMASWRAALARSLPMSPEA